MCLSHLSHVWEVSGPCIVIYEGLLLSGSPVAVADAPLPSLGLLCLSSPRLSLPLPHSSILVLKAHFKGVGTDRVWPVSFSLSAAGVMVSSKDYNQKHLAPLISRGLAVASVARPCVVLVNLYTHPGGSRELTQALHFPLLWPLSMLGEKLSWRSLVE